MRNSNIFYVTLILLVVLLYLTYNIYTDSIKIQNIIENYWILPVIQRVELVVPPTSIDWMKDGVFKPLNPSIRKESGNYAVILRYANTETNNGISFKHRGHKGFTMNRTVIANYDSNFKIVYDKKEPIEVEIPSHYIVNKETNVYGVEDCRWLGANSFLGTAIQFSEASVNRMVRVDMDPTTQSVSKLQRLYPPIIKDDTLIQKNWLPFIRDGQELYIYKISPFMVCNMNNEIILERTLSSPYVVSCLRGSAAPVPWKSNKIPTEAWLMIVHFFDSDVPKFIGFNRIYYHQFMTLDVNLVPSRISNVFKTVKEPIQYVSGLCESVQAGRYVLTMGVNDSQAWALEIESSIIENSLVEKLS